jgi:type I restriction enzyme S subunit
MANDELPAGWVNADFGSVTTLKTGPFGSSLGKKDYTHSGVPLVNPMHIHNGKIVPKDSALVSPQTIERLSEFCLIVRDVVLGRRGEMGRCAVVGEAQSGWLCGTGSLIVRPTQALHPEYLQRFLSSPSVVAELVGASVGSTMVNLNQRILADLRIPLPPLAEQKRIADKLEAVLGRVDACRARLDRVPALLKRFRQSVLAAATSGKLTEEWRTGERLPPWSKRPLGDLCEKGRIITYGVIKLGDETPGGIPCLRTSNVRWLNIDVTGMKRIEKKLSEDYSRTILHGGEVLVNVRGTLGGVAVAEAGMKGWNVSREVAVVPVDRSALLPQFLAFFIGAESSQAWLTGVQKGVAYTGINIEDLRQLPVGIPSLPEQQEIVRRVEALFAFADRIEARLATARKTVERLTPATLAKAFRGELVPQDPNDEPAAALLERLHAQTDPATAKSKRGRRAKSTSA